MRNAAALLTNFVGGLLMYKPQILNQNPTKKAKFQSQIKIFTVEQLVFLNFHTPGQSHSSYMYEDSPRQNLYPTLTLPLHVLVAVSHGRPVSRQWGPAVFGDTSPSLL